MEMIEFTARNRKERRGRPQHQSMLLLNPLARKELTCQESTRKGHCVKNKLSEFGFGLRSFPSVTSFIDR